MSIVPAGNAQPALASRRFGKKSILAIVVALILIGISVPPFINVSRYRARIADAISRALGRPVTHERHQPATAAAAGLRSGEPGGGR